MNCQFKPHLYAAPLPRDGQGGVELRRGKEKEIACVVGIQRGPTNSTIEVRLQLPALSQPFYNLPHRLFRGVQWEATAAGM